MNNGGVNMDWTKISIYQLTALVAIGTLYSFMQFQPQTKEVLAQLDKYSQEERTVVIFENQTVEEVVAWFSQPFEVKDAKQNYVIVKFAKLEPLYKFVGMSEQDIVMLFKQFKILDISQQKTKDDTFVFALVQKVQE